MLFADCNPGKSAQCVAHLPRIKPTSRCSPVHTILKTLDPVGDKGVQKLRWSLLQSETWYACRQSPLDPVHDDIPSLFPKQCYKECCLSICLHVRDTQELSVCHVLTRLRGLQQQLMACSHKLAADTTRYMLLKHGDPMVCKVWIAVGKTTCNTEIW